MPTLSWWRKRRQTMIPDFYVQGDGDEDNNAARGLLVGLCVGATIWGMILVVAWMYRSHLG